MDIRRVTAVLNAALRGGYAEHVGLGKYRLLLAMDCENPYRFELYSRGSIRDGVRVRPLTLFGESRCRKCFSCARRRSKMWAARAIAEYDKWPMTIFGTFTMSPEEHYLADVRAARLAAERHVDFDCATDAERFTYRARVFGAEVTNWIKRIRAGRDGHTFTPVRYLLVAEVHDSENTSLEMRGRPHYHMLLHCMQAGSAIIGSPQRAIEVGPEKLRCDVAAGEWECRNVLDKHGRWIPHAFLRDEAFLRREWTFGHTKWQWAEDHRSAFYVCKYLTKAMHVRVRASLHYGEGVPTK